MRSVDLFLNPEERFEIYSVKSAERPHHLLPSTTSGAEQGNNDDDVLPLIDGCDIPQWRSHGLVPTSPSLEAALNVGLGCSLLRRESQLPLPTMMMSAHRDSRWKKLRDLLMERPVTASVEEISCSEASQFLCSSMMMMGNGQQGEEKHNNEVRVGASKFKCQQGSASRRQKYFSKWEQANVPVIITGCCTTSDSNGWNLDAWKFESLVERFGHVRWRFSDTHGALLSLDTYAKYISSDEGLLDDAPLGVYDSEFGNSDSPMKDLLRDYQVPPCFSDDLFALATAADDDDDDGDERGDCYDGFCVEKKENDSSEKQQSDNESEVTTTTTNSLHHQSRPPWRWILIGPPRSGTGLHIDPLWTNAWVTLLEGTKRWILIPPELISQLPPGAGLQEPQVPSALWFHKYYEEVSQLEGVVEILQRPGQTVFVPNGWPHLVLNLERTVAVTHNYASEFGPFDIMWEQVAQDEPEFAQRWYRGLCQHRPDLAFRIQKKKLDKIHL